MENKDQNKVCIACPDEHLTKELLEKVVPEIIKKLKIAKGAITGDIDTTRLEVRFVIGPTDNDKNPWLDFAKVEYVLHTRETKRTYNTTALE